MFSWVTSWWKLGSRPIQGHIAGPARNAPNDGHNIKEFIEEQKDQAKLASLMEITSQSEVPKGLRNNSNQGTAVQIMVVSSDDIKDARARLRQTSSSKQNLSIQDPPLLREMSKVFNQGHEQYFAERKRLKEEKQLKAELEKLVKWSEERRLAEEEAELEAEITRMTQAQFNLAIETARLTVEKEEAELADQRANLLEAAKLLEEEARLASKEIFKWSEEIRSKSNSLESVSKVVAQVEIEPNVVYEPTLVNPDISFTIGLHRKLAAEIDEFETV